MRWMWLCVVAIGCEAPTPGAGGADGVAGGDGAAGATGAQGAQGAPGGGYRWHDATGAQVTQSSEAVWFDDRGRMWFVGINTAELWIIEGPGTYFSAPDCGGRELVIGYGGPRQPFGTAGRPEVFVAPDDLVKASECVESFDGGAGCSNSAFCVDLYNVTDLDVVPGGVPNVGWVAPLHPEEIN